MNSPVIPAQWSPQSIVDLANPRCMKCRGLGTSHKPGPCGCVLRRVFNICYHKYESITSSDRYQSKVTTRGGINACRPNEEYVADFVLIGRRVLSTHPKLLQQVFELHILRGLESLICVNKIRTVNRGRFFHGVYKVQELLGREFHDLTPYALYPLQSYFSRSIELKVIPVSEVTLVKAVVPIRPPLAVPLDKAA